MTGPAVEPATRPRIASWLLLEAATFTAGTANGAMALALSWLALERGGGATGASLVAAAVALPLMVSTMFSGALVDRFGRRLAAISAELLSALAILAVPFVDRFGSLTLASLVGLTIVGAMLEQTGVIAREASVPVVAARAGRRLEFVNGIHQAVWALALLAGPAVAGVLISRFDATSALVLIGTMFAVSAGLSLGIRGGLKSAHDPTSFLRQARAGLEFAWRHRLLRALLLLTVPMVAVYLPIEALLLPIRFKALDAPGQLGGIIATISGSAIVGAIGYGTLGHRWRRSTVLRGALLAVGAAAVMMSISSWYPATVAAAVVLGLAYGPVSPLVMLAVQRETPAHMRGRVIGTLTACTYAAGPVGFLATGSAVTAFGVRPVFVTLSVLLLVLGTLAAVLPGLTALDHLALAATSPDPSGPDPSGADPSGADPSAHPFAAVHVGDRADAARRH